jgi:hypothetical protein
MHTQAKDFWTQYEKPEKFQTELAEVLRTKSLGRRNPMERLDRHQTAEAREEAMAEIDAALAEVQLRHGIDIDHQLAYNGAKTPQKQDLLLLAA